MEARRRGSTICLMDQSIEMLPGLLSSGFCSLIQNQQRFCFSVILELNDKAKIYNCSFRKSIINSQAALTYEEADQKILNTKEDSEITRSIKLLFRMTKFLNKRRIKKRNLQIMGNLDFQFDDEDDTIDDEKSEIISSCKMVEETMIWINHYVAKKIVEALPNSCLLRKMKNVHNFTPLIQAGRTKGFDIKVNSKKDLDDYLEVAVVPEDAAFNSMLRGIANQCVAQAFYFSSGFLEKSEYFHEKMNLPIYTHFSSPIRRYSDIIVHRQLAVAIGVDVSSDPCLVDKNKMQELANNLNFQTSLENLYRNLSLKKTAEGFVTWTDEGSMGVSLPKFTLVPTLNLYTRKSPNEAIASIEEKQSEQASEMPFQVYDVVEINLVYPEENAQPEKSILAVKKLN